jgi:hypothetical protein
MPLSKKQDFYCNFFWGGNIDLLGIQASLEFLKDACEKK